MNPKLRTSTFRNPIFRMTLAILWLGCAFEIPSLQAQQVPQGIMHQSVIRNNTGQLVSNQAVTARISLLQGSASGSAVYVETHQAQTNANGLLSLKVGGGLAQSGAGLLPFNQIAWGSGPYFLQTEVDPSGGNNFSLIQTTELLSVPFALMAQHSLTPGPAGPQGPQGPSGAQGSQGAVGPQGPAGADGAPGVAGPVGPQGPAGNDGAVGPQGPIGLTGPAGPAGNDGAVGPQGPSGADGAPGVAGPVGPQGPAGPAGNDGAVGPQGPQGSFPSGTQPGEMNYWNGTTWVSVPPGTNGQVLTFCNGVPSWNGCFPSVTTNLASNITFNTAVTGGNVVSEGLSSVTARGVAYGTVQNPTTANSTTSDGTGTGVFTSTLSGLTASTLYYVRAYATNSVGTAYGSQVSFTTSAVLPTVITTSVTGITSTGATTGGNVTADGGATVTARGVAYGTAQNPTTANSITSNGTGTGVFTSTLSGLTASTLYYVRAYATNAVGTGYGTEVSFTTSAPPFLCGTSTVSDVDNNTYNTVQIGTQCWTQSNLKVSKYSNGDNIPTGLSNSAWENTTSGAYAIYNNAPVNDGLYGKLYNHYAVTDGRGLCPTGWHVPSDAEWTTLENQLGGSSVAGGALKSTATQPTPGGWASPNSGATNSSGFTALPGGFRLNSGDFFHLTDYGYWWSSSVNSGSNVWFRYLYVNFSSFNRSSFNRLNGLSVRCLKD